MDDIVHFTKILDKKNVILFFFYKEIEYNNRKVDNIR